VRCGLFPEPTIQDRRILVTIFRLLKDADVLDGNFSHSIFDLLCYLIHAAGKEDNCLQEEVLSMEQVAYNMPTLNRAAHAVEVVVHIPERLDDKQRHNLVVALENSNGIVSAEFCHLRDHLMLVRYDRDHYSSQHVLNALRTQNVNARLIGPI
jgi:hypothetical protein